MHSLFSFTVLLYSHIIFHKIKYPVQAILSLKKESRPAQFLAVSSEQLSYGVQSAPWRVPVSTGTAAVGMQGYTVGNFSNFNCCPLPSVSSINCQLVTELSSEVFTAAMTNYLRKLSPSDSLYLVF